jgi:hypothetical protein
MPSLDDIYRKFGEASEAAQLLETELGNILIASGLAENNLVAEQVSERVPTLIKKIDRQTLGQLLANLSNTTESGCQVEALLSRALDERNRLSHSFYRHHNLRRNTEEGRAIMLKDLESIHAALLEAYKAVMLLSGIDLNKIVLDQLPTKHLPI